MVPANGDSLTVKLLASYKPAETPTVTKYAWLEIRVEDGTCICPAKIYNTWLNFMCHNLGGLDIISPSQLITYEHHGDWYLFGAKNASMINIPTNDTNNDWDDPNYSSSGNWPDNNNPCPAGWRLPTNVEWSTVIIVSYNTSANVPDSWVAYQSDQSVFSNLKKLGNALILPAAGYRNSNGRLNHRSSNGYYWSSTEYDYNDVYGGRLMAFDSSETLYTGYNSYNTAFSVRCVEK
jgi:uncharacterized protein (TIGR02145 family)